MPSAFTSYRPAGCGTKSVSHYYGDPDAPKALVVIEEGIDHIVNTEQWTGTADEIRALRKRY